MFTDMAMYCILAIVIVSFLLVRFLLNRRNRRDRGAVFLVVRENLPTLNDTEIERLVDHLQDMGDVMSLTSVREATAILKSLDVIHELVERIDGITYAQADKIELVLTPDACAKLKTKEEVNEAIICIDHVTQEKKVASFRRRSMKRKYR